MVAVTAETATETAAETSSIMQQSTCNQQATREDRHATIDMQSTLDLGERARARWRERERKRIAAVIGTPSHLACSTGAERKREIERERRTAETQRNILSTEAILDQQPLLAVHAVLATCGRLHR